MEKIRAYNLEDLSRASRLLHKKRDIHEYEIYLREGPNRVPSEKQLHTSQLADEMYATHKEWVDQKLGSLIPYLQRKTNAGGKGNSKEFIKKSYKDGLAMKLTLLGSRCSDSQDAVVAYTVGFITMLRVCERFDVNPISALLLAQQPFTMNARKLAQLFEKHTNVPRIVIERAANHPAPEKILKAYADRAQVVKQLAADERYQNIPEDVLIRASYPQNKPEMFLNKYLKEQLVPPAVVQFAEMPSPNAFVIEGVPVLKQKHVGWCGFTSAAVVLQHYGYSELTPERIFTYINGEYDRLLEYIDQGPGPSIDTLALAIQELTSLKVDLWTTEKYEKLKQKNSARTPQDVLKAYIMQKKVPCIVRTPGHFLVVNGFDVENNRYLINDPLGHMNWRSADKFEDRWSQKSPDYPRDTSHLMLAIYPQKK